MKADHDDEGEAEANPSSAPQELSVAFNNKVSAVTREGTLESQKIAGIEAVVLRRPVVDIQFPDNDIVAWHQVPIDHDACHSKMKVGFSMPSYAKVFSPHWSLKHRPDIAGGTALLGGGRRCPGVACKRLLGIHGRACLVEC